VLPFISIAGRVLASCFLATGTGSLLLIPSAHAPACWGHANLQPDAMVLTAAAGQSQSPRDSQVHLIRVIDGASGFPIANAKVIVELKNAADDRDLGRREGKTDSQGVFVFTCEARNGAARTEITAEAKGFSTLHVYSSLAKEAVIKLSKEDS
jgi:hypothetical protein